MDALAPATPIEYSTGCCLSPCPVTALSSFFRAMTERMISDVLSEPDAALEMTLRPSLFSEFTGQAKVKERLEITVAAARQRSEPIDHLLLSGPPGLGKTTLAHILAKAMGANLKSTSGPTIEKAGDLAGLLTNLEEGDVLFIDEIHRLQKTIEEYLYPAMEDFKLDIIIDQGPNARDRKSTRLNSSHLVISYAVFCLKKKKEINTIVSRTVRPALGLFAYLRLLERLPRSPRHISAYRVAACGVAVRPVVPCSTDDVWF